jgi:hypothetical protein
MPPQGGTRSSLVDTMGRPLMIQSQGELLGAAVSAADFSPGQPISPVREEPIRVWDFPVGVNTTITPRGNEPFGFHALRAFANVELVRMAIETRKDQLERLDWQIKASDEKAAKKDKTSQSRIDKVRKFFKKPNGTDSFATWLRLLTEDLLVIDAPALERLRNRGGDLIGLDVVPGDTIKCLVDQTGRRPQPPYPAFEQIIKGRVWNTLTAEDLIYAPRNRRPNHLYGFSPVEQIVVTIHTIINRQARQLAYFTEGNTPPGFLSAPEGATPAQVKELQTWLNAALSGNPAERAKALMVGPGAKWQAVKDPPLKDEFDEWLARIVVFAFSLPPTPFIKQMNRSTSDNDQDRSLEEGLEPLKLWVSRLITGVIQDDLGEDDLEFSWVDTPSIDPKIQAEIDNINLANGSDIIDHVRDTRGLDPLPNGMGAFPFLHIATGGVTLDQIKLASDNVLNPPEPPAPVAQAPSAAQADARIGPDGKPVATPKPGEPDAPPQPEAKKLPEPAAKLGKAAQITADRPKARRHAVALRKALTPILAKCGDEVSAEVGMQLRGMHKAADDSGLTFAQIAQRIADAVSLAGLYDVSSAVYEELLEIANDSAQLAVVSVGATDTDGLFDRVYQRAVDFARQRAAQLVSVQGPDNIVGSTRDMIRAVIAQGLEDNIGSSKIADAVQASTAFSAERAELIARTEIANANGAGKLEGWKATGLTLRKSWLTNAGCCDACADNEAASPIPLDDTFPSGDDAEGAHPGCECVTTAEEVPAEGGDDEA